jgi:hypothetical protein
MAKRTARNRNGDVVQRRSASSDDRSSVTSTQKADIITQKKEIRRMGQETLDVGEAGEKTALGFGGKTIGRRLHRGDEFYVLMHCYVSSEGEKETQEGGLSFSAGARTDILCEISESDAVEIARARGWVPKEEQDEEPDDLDLKTSDS